MAKIISSLPGSTGVLSKTSQLINDGETGISAYVELNDLSTVATTGDYNNLINVPVDFTPKVHTHNISDISGTKSEFDTSLTDGDFLFEGDITQYTDELAQDAVGSILTETATIDFTYDDITPTVSANVKLNSIDATHLTDGINITEFTNNANYETTSQLNIRDTNNRNRVNHTGEQPISTVTGLQTNLDLKQDALGFTPENVVNKVTDISTGTNNTTYPSSLAVKTYADNLVVGMLNDRGTWDASGNVFPTTGGSGVGGVIRKGDMWYVSVAGILGTKLVNVGDSFRALVNAPAQVAANWSIFEANIGYVPANDSNVVHLTGAETITGVKSFSPSVSASSAVARGTYFTPKLSATANNDILVGLDINPTFTNGSFTGTTSLPVRVTSNQYIGMNVSRNSTGGSAITISNNNGGYNFGVGSINEFFIQRAGGNIVNTIFPTGNSVIQNGGTFTDDNINRLQVNGTVSSGTTALGNTPPTANNQLTRKDYVDSGLALKANDNAVVHLTGAETITGAKTFNDISAVTNYKSSTNNVIISDTDGFVFRAFRSGAWPDNVRSRFIQVGDPNDNVVFTTRFGAAANRMLFSSLKTQISSGSIGAGFIPLGIFEVINGANRLFNVFESGNSVFGDSPDDNVNRLQVNGTVSSGTTALGNTPPTANNQLTRKDYVDTGLATKEPSFTKNTAFNKNFGTTAGTVVEGGTLGSNAYNSTAYLPLSGGTLSGTVTASSYTATSLPVFENNALASSLSVGQFYRTSIGVLMVKF